MSKVAFIGVGVMEYPMAGHLARTGHEVTVYNRTAQKAARCVGNDDDLREVTGGPQSAFRALHPGSVYTASVSGVVGNARIPRV